MWRSGEVLMMSLSAPAHQFTARRSPSPNTAKQQRHLMTKKTRCTMSTECRGISICHRVLDGDQSPRSKGRKVLRSIQSSLFVIGPIESLKLSNMSKSFSFPPPPPPPPRARGDQENTGLSLASNNSNRAPVTHRERGQGGSNRGRGSGRANVDHVAHAHDSRQQVVDPSARNSRSYHVHSNASNLPPGSYVNPRFHSQHTGQRNENVRRPQTQAKHPSRTAAGHKRKLEALRTPQPDVVYPGPPVAPEVPNFGDALSHPNRHANPPLASTKMVPSTNAFGLIPVERDPHGDYLEGSDDDKEVDEEALFAELGDRLTFEHNGTVVVLSTVADIAAWQHERKKNWPTKARMEEKDAENRAIGAERRRLLSAASILNEPSAAMSERNIKRETTADASTQHRTVALTSVGSDTKVECMRQHLVEQSDKLELLRKKVAMSQERLDGHKAKQVADDERLAETLARRPPVNGGSTKDNPKGNLSDEDTDALSDSSVVSSDSDEERGNDPARQAGPVQPLEEEDPDNDDDDGPPEEASSKRSEKSSAESRPLCKFFTSSGRCRDGDECTFRHEQGPQSQRGAVKLQYPPKAVPPASTSQRKGIFQRLAEQEQEENDRLVLQVVKSLVDDSERIFQIATALKQKTLSSCSGYVCYFASSVPAKLASSPPNIKASSSTSTVPVTSHRRRRSSRVLHAPTENLRKTHVHPSLAASQTLPSTPFVEHDADTRRHHMSLDRSPSPHRGGGWSSPGLTTPVDDRSGVPRSRGHSPGQAYANANGEHGVTWATAKQRSERVNGYPSYQSQNQGFFARHMRKLSEQLPQFAHGGQEDRYIEKEKLGRGRTGNQMSRSWTWLQRTLGINLSRRRKYTALLVAILVGLWIMFHKRKFCRARAGDVVHLTDERQLSPLRTDVRLGLEVVAKLS
nr:hypothetical protein CFP56_10084 [Quercus suber]